MIPKIIHYCWFGGKPKPDCVVKCISTWRDKLPDYEIKEWNESNFNLTESIGYVKEAYENKKWAFVTDYVRLKALYEFGGIYFDTDVEVFKSFDDLLDNKSFFGFESNDYLCTAVIACEKYHPFIKKFMESYDSRKFLLPDGTFDTATTNVIAVTHLLKKDGMKPNGSKQIVGDVTVFPQYYFSSNDLINVFHKYSKEIYSYHHCQATWYQNERSGKFWDLFRHYLIGKLRNIIGTDTLLSLKGK